MSTSLTDETFPNAPPCSSFQTNHFFQKRNISSLPPATGKKCSRPSPFFCSVVFSFARPVLPLALFWSPRIPFFSPVFLFWSPWAEARRTTTLILAMAILLAIPFAVLLSILLAIRLPIGYLFSATFAFFSIPLATCLDPLVRFCSPPDAFVVHARVFVDTWRGI